MATSGDFSRTGARVERATAVTNGAGQATVTWPAGTFTTPPVIALAVEGGAAFRSARVVTNTAVQTVVQVSGAAVVELLGIQLLAAALPAGGVTVHAHAVAAS